MSALRVTLRHNILRLAMSLAPAIKTKLCKIEVPQVILDHNDCDPSMPVPGCSTWSDCTILPPPARRLTFPVPPNSEEGCLLQIPVDGTTLSKELPPGLVPGDTALAFQREGEWRLVKKPTDFAFLCEAKAGSKVKPQLPDGSFLHFEVPEGVGPGHVVELHHQGSWQLKRVVELTEVQRVPAQSNTIRGPFMAALDFLSRNMSKQHLVPDQEGFLIVNVPFCGRFQEYAMLGNFLAQECLSLPGVKGAKIFAADNSDRYYYDWAVARRWFAEFQPHIEVHLCVRDLQYDPLPKAALTIALHPEVTKGGSWFPIMGSLMKASEGGVCLVASFFHDEVTTVLNMVDMYDSSSRQRQVSENSFWKEPANQAVREAAPSKRMNYLLLLQPSTPVRAETSLFQWFGQFISCFCRSK